MPLYDPDVATLRVALCQLDTVVGDLDGNVDRILAAYQEAERASADVAVFPELAVTGYPPEDLLLKPAFVAANIDALDAIARHSGDCAAVVGFVELGRDLHNAAAVCAGGVVRGVYRKRHLPNYAVFDEQRYFTAGRGPLHLFEIAGVRVGISICEDAWSPDGPIDAQADGGAEVLLNLNASPYYRGRLAERERMLATRAQDAHCHLVYVNQVGGQDELVFDGASLIVDRDGEVVHRMSQFREGTDIVDLEIRPVYRKRLLDPRGRTSADPLPATAVSERPARHGVERPGTVARALGPVDEVYEALVTATRGYVTKNGFVEVVIGLSGGVDSSLVAAVAVDALGSDRVHGVAMPSRHSSDHSRSDAERLAERLGIELRTIAIEPAHLAFEAMLGPSLSGHPAELTHENLQPRIRGVLLMALSNTFPGWLVLTTGNKSELAVGYSTLYGDTAGGFAVIKDVPKLLVYELCRARNQRAGRDVIPEAVLAKAPSAELRPDQRDDQTLPPYEVLDPLLEAYVEDDRTRAELVAAGHDAALVDRIAHLVDLAEYKRRQSPPGPRLTPKAFGKDRRMPITNRFRG